MQEMSSHEDRYPRTWV